MEYSPLKEIRVKNFRSVGDITLSFEDSPIISLVGDNEAGKTSFVKSIQVIGGHAYPKDQKGFIRDETSGFGIAMKTVDEELVTRFKNNASNIYTLDIPGQDRWGTDKIDGGAGVPVRVQEITGFVIDEETGEMLNVRTYEDGLLFVTTTASQNYKVMYNALKVDTISRAIKCGQEEVNELQAQYNRNEIVLRNLLENIRSIRIFDIEPALNMRERLSGLLTVINKADEAIAVKRRVDRINDLLSIENELERNGINEIAMDYCEKIVNIRRLLDGMCRINNVLLINDDINAIEYIDVSLMEKVKMAMDKLNYVFWHDKKIEILSQISQLEEIEHDVLDTIKQALSLKDREVKVENMIKVHNLDGIEEMNDRTINIMMGMVSAINRLRDNKVREQEIKLLNNEIEMLNNEIITMGAIVAECDNCGNTVIIGS